jgi:hypothetical protein
VRSVSYLLLRSFWRWCRRFERPPCYIRAAAYRESQRQLESGRWATRNCLMVAKAKRVDEHSSTQTQQGKTVIDTSVKMCQSKELTKSLQSNGEELRKKNECTSTVTQPSPNTYVEESHCSKGPNAGSVTRIIYTYQSDTASHTEMHMNAGKSETVMTMDAKYLGSCPAGMKPGDAVMADGKKIAGGN